MADLADKIDDLICTFDGNVNTTLDTIAMYMFGIFVFVLLTVVILYHLYGKYKKPKQIAASATTSAANEKTQNLGSETKTSVKDLSSGKNVPSGGSAAKTVPSTPPVRKRLGSKSGKIANISTKPKSIILPPPATGAEVESTKWVNELFLWLYSDLAIVNELVNFWIQSLNESMKQSVAEHGVGVELIRMLPETHPPSLNNIFCECAPNDDVTITCDCEVTPSLQLKAFRQKGDKVETSHYRVNVTKLRGRLNIYCITEKLQAEVKFDGWPEIKILLAQVGSLKNNNLDEQSLQEVIIEIVTSALRNSCINYNLSQYHGCPRLIRKPPAPAQYLPLHYDSMLMNSNSNLSRTGGSGKLTVKVVKAAGLAVDGAKINAYCVIEVDNPPAIHQTGAIFSNTNSPVWEEQCVFDVNAKTKEIMFEVYNNTGHKENEKNQFLGLAIVSVQELLESPSQRQVISLQPRPYQNDKVNGTLTLEFMLLDGVEANGKQTIDEKSYSATPNKSRTITSKTIYSNPLDRDYMMNGVAEKALKDLESQSKNSSNMSPNKSTLIIHSVQKQPQNQNTLQVNQNMTKRWHEVHFSSKDGNQNQNYEANVQNPQDTPDTSQQNGDDQGRGRRRKRDFFGTIRRRLNKSRGRAKSIDRNALSNGEATADEATTGCHSPSTRSVSADRARDHSAHSAHSTVGPLPREGSARSSLSEMSGVSGASSRTYLNEASTLILETVENGIKKYYLVPLSLAQKNKWKKKGTKLHIYNDHTFVAKHLPGGTNCQICNRTLPRRLGKQGYECRDCSLKCHKQCHVRTDSSCPNSTVQNLELSGSLKIPKLGAGR
ncbi:uncharacterized protein LOC135832992 isoform X2 [Planococcus citri]|uniref:uncharacterized protein LOC135832992 isoform X2 n=1 Tax=Planococcus citri TaxID=170843 RepID=UPI0031F93AAB